MPLSGIDVSYAQNLIDWTQVATANLSFAFAKASEGITIADAQFVANWQGMQTAGLIRGAYHFFHPNDDPDAQANNFLAALAAANGNSPLLATGDLPVAVDVEVTGNASPAALCATLQTYLDIVQAATGRAPIIYTGRSFWNTATASSTAFAAYPLWIAEYGVSTPHGLPAGWPTYTFWQSTQSLQPPIIPGLTTPTDGDVFNGLLHDLQALAP
jgi:lysozyme